MPGIEDIVAGGIGTGIQPRDNPSPVPGGITAANQLSGNSLPKQPLPPIQGGGIGQPQPAAPAPTTPPPSATAQPDVDGGEEDERKIAAQMVQKLDAAAPKKEFSDGELIQNILSGARGAIDPSATIVDPKKRHESEVDYKLRSMSDEGKFIWTQMRKHLATTDEGQKAAVESAYGAANVKEQDGAVYFRPNPDSKFRKFDQEMFGKWTDRVLFNSLKAIPLAANVMTQGAVMGGAVAGAPESAGLSLTGMAAAGAAGGAAEVGTRRWLQAVTSAFGDKPVVEGNLTGDAMTVAGNSAFGAAGGAMLGPARAAVGKLGAELTSAFPAATGVLKGIATSAAEGAEKAAGGVATQLVRAREGLKSAITAFYPHAGDLESSEAFGKALQPVFTSAEKRLGETIGQIKEEVIAAAGNNPNPSKQMVPMDNAMKSLGEELKAYGYAQDVSSGEMELKDSSKLILAEGKVRSTLDLMQKQFNLLSKAKAGAGGVYPQEAFDFAEQLGTRAGFAKNSPQYDDEAKRLFFKAWQSHVEDRNAFIESTLNNSGSQFAGTWGKEFAKYHDQIGAVREVSDLLKTDVSKENYLKVIMSGSTATRNNFLLATKNMLQDQSPDTWKGLQGQLVNRVLDTSTENGVVRADKMLKFMNAKDNEPLMNLLFENKDATVFKKALLETQAIDKKGLTESSKDAVKDLATSLIKMASHPAQAVMNFFKATGNNAESAKYLMSDGFSDLINQAEVPAIKRNFMQARRLMEDVTDKMKILDVPTVTEAGVKRNVKRFAPAISQGATDTLMNTNLGQALQGNQPSQ